jgi:hypothetical protein
MLHVLHFLEHIVGLKSCKSTLDEVGRKGHDGNLNKIPTGFADANNGQ